MEEPEAVAVNITPEELAIAFAMPAPFVNKTLLTSIGFQARLSFLEIRTNGDDTYRSGRSAVTMDLAELLKLRDLISRLEEKMQFLEINAETGTENG